MKNPFVFSNDFVKGFLIASLFFVVAAISIIINTLAIRATVNFIDNHNFDVTKYSGNIRYYAYDGDEFDVYPYVTDTEGRIHEFSNLPGESTHYLTDKHLPKEDSYLHVFEVKLYNSKTQKLRLLRLIW